MFGNLSVARARLPSLANDTAPFFGDLQANPLAPLTLAPKARRPHLTFVPLALILSRAHSALVTPGHR
jgi:hypothetical protein